MGVQSPASRRAPERAIQALHAAAAALSFSVVADSALEHYRGGFYNHLMYVAPTVSGLTLLASASARVRPRTSPVRQAIFGTAVATGVVGTGFHLYNVLKRAGGLSWQNAFRGAPLAAPLGITFAGLFALAASSLDRSRSRHHPRLLGVPAAPLVGSAAALGLLGTAAEAGLLHFRGAFQNPFMYVPVTLPPLASLALGAALRSPTPGRRSLARVLLQSTAVTGLAGMAFHTYGIHRWMGGWRNWSQAILLGPPLPAPPSFTGMALAGLAGLSLLDAQQRA